MFDISISEFVVIFIVALIIFGPKKLPDIARSLGKGIAEFKRALNEVKESLNFDDEETPLKNKTINEYEKKEDSLANSEEYKKADEIYKKDLTG